MNPFEQNKKIISMEEEMYYVLSLSATIFLNQRYSFFRMLNNPIYQLKYQADQIISMIKFLYKYNKIY